MFEIELKINKVGHNFKKKKKNKQTINYDVLLILDLIERDIHEL